MTISPHAKLQSLDANQVRLHPGFWGDRFEQFVRVSLPLLYRQAVDPAHGHVLSNFRIAAGLEKGEFVGTDWQDEWAYKWIEAASIAWAVTHDQQLMTQMDTLIDAIAQAQAPDGYIATQSLRRGGKRFLSPMHHELYVMGHLMTAACAHSRCTGKRTLLEVAIKAADFVSHILEANRARLAHFPINPSIVMGGVDLYRATGNRRYLHMSQTIVDMRGAYEQTIQPDRAEFDTEPVRLEGYGDANQDRIPLRVSTKVVGHSVFWSYLYAGAADIYAETGETALLEALRRLWRDLVDHKLYITGGCCAVHKGFSYHGESSWDADVVFEAVGLPFELPNATAYNETCAQVGAFLWAWRMLQITGEAEFADVMEREMYNGFLPGVGLGGRDWFYTNPLARWSSQPMLTSDSRLRHQIGREKQICCPTNILRTVISMRKYLYSFSDYALWVHHYTAGGVEDPRIGPKQATAYPWDGRVTLTITAAPPKPIALRLRIPHWSDHTTIHVNGRPLRTAIAAGSYATVERDWRVGDTVELVLDLTPRLVVADGRVESARNQAAVMRGPLVYCMESVDLPAGVSLADVYLPRDASFVAVAEAELWDAVALKTEAVHRPPAGAGLYRPLPRQERRVPVRLIPYFAWCNRGVTEMIVWLPLA